MSDTKTVVPENAMQVSAPIVAHLTPISSIFLDMDFNSRGEELNPTDVAGLAGNIEEKTTPTFCGLLQPVVVSDIPESRRGDPRAVGCDKWLICGYRRTLAFKVLNRTEIPAIYIPGLTELDARFMNLAENLERKQLTFFQEARSIAPFLAMDMGEAKIAQKISQTRGWVQIRKMFLQFAPDMQVFMKTNPDYITQHQIRDIYSILKTSGEAVARRTMTEMADAKLTGHTKRVSAERKAAGNISLRNKSEMTEMQNYIRAQIGNGPITKALGWACGNLSNAEFASAILQEAKLKGKDFIPREDMLGVDSTAVQVEGDGSDESKG